MSNLEPHACFVDSKFRILCQTSQTGQARTGMETRPKPCNKTPLSDLIPQSLNQTILHGLTRFPTFSRSDNTD